MVKKMKWTHGVWMSSSKQSIMVLPNLKYNVWCLWLVEWKKWWKSQKADKPWTHSNQIETKIFKTYKNIQTKQWFINVLSSCSDRFVMWLLSKTVSNGSFFSKIVKIMCGVFYEAITGQGNDCSVVLAWIVTESSSMTQRVLYKSNKTRSTRNNGVLSD